MGSPKGIHLKFSGIPQSYLARLPSRDLGTYTHAPTSLREPDTGTRNSDTCKLPGVELDSALAFTGKTWLQRLSLEPLTVENT
jgi:hypothetical protein